VGEFDAAKEAKVSDPLQIYFRKTSGTVGRVGVFDAVKEAKVVDIGF